MSATKQITVRMPLEILEQLGGMPKGKGAPYIVEAVRERLARDKQAKIDEGLRCLAYDDETNDLSAFESAQAEVLARVD
jgi:hypothetical protein